MQSAGSKEQELVLVEHAFEYSSKDGKIISIKPNERYILLKRTNEHWWQVCLDKTTTPFYIPAKYVKVLPLASKRFNGYQPYKDPSEDVQVAVPSNEYSYKFLPPCPQVSANVTPPPLDIQPAITDNAITSRNECASKALAPVKVPCINTSNTLPKVSMPKLAATNTLPSATVPRVNSNNVQPKVVPQIHINDVLTSTPQIHSSNILPTNDKQNSATQPEPSTQFLPSDLPMVCGASGLDSSHTYPKEQPEDSRTHAPMRTFHNSKKVVDPTKRISFLCLTDAQPNILTTPSSGNLKPEPSTTYHQQQPHKINDSSGLCCPEQVVIVTSNTAGSNGISPLVQPIKEEEDCGPLYENLKPFQKETPRERASSLQHSSTSTLDDWETHTDTGSGQLFYYNSVTGVTTWDSPFDQPEDPEPSPTSLNSLSPLAEDSQWEKHFDEATKKYYFYNSVTGETSWDPPVEEMSFQEFTPMVSSYISVDRRPPTPEADYPDYSLEEGESYPDADYHQDPPGLYEQIPLHKSPVDPNSGWFCQVNKEGKKCYSNSYNSEIWVQSEDQSGKTFFYTPDGSLSQWSLPRIGPASLHRPNDDNNVFTKLQDNYPAITARKDTEDFGHRLRRAGSEDFLNVGGDHHPHQTKSLEKAGVLHKAKISDNGKKLRKSWSSSWTVLLDSKQVRQEELKKVSLLSNLREEELMTPLKRSGNESQVRAGTSVSFDSGIGGLSSTSQFVNQTCSQLEETCSRWNDQEVVSLQEAADVQLSIWVSYYEIYNEFVYDLLDFMPSGPNRKRTTLRLCEDRNGNPYVKDLTWINVHSAEEAWKILRVGRKNQSFASTHLNQNSSRSHSIFSIRILHMQGKNDLTPKISELSFCDLAGSERCKDQRSGDRLKEATNINTSLHTLGRCITVLRQNQQQKLRQNVVPFRDSKLTRIFQAYFTGRGKSCMIVNINQCASTYDETLYAMKFSAIASQLVQAPPVKVNIPSIQSLIKESTMLANRSYTDEEDADENSDEESEETDIAKFNREELLQVIENMKELIVKERQEKLNMEIQIRKEVCSEMMDMMQQQQKQHSESLEDERELLEEIYEGRLENLKESLTNYYKHELEERDERIEELEAALKEAMESVHSMPSQPTEREESLSVRRSKRLATAEASNTDKFKQELLNLKMELQSKNEEIEKFKKMQEPPVSARSYTADVDKKIVEGQRLYGLGSLHKCTDFQHTRALWNVRLLRTELQRFGDSLQQVDRVCCHTTGAEKLRQALGTCDDILSKQERALAELQNNMVLVKMDLKKKAVCIAEQYNTVQKLQGTTSGYKRLCNNENVQPNNPEKKPFLRNFLARTPGKRGLAENSPYSRILRSRRSPVLKTVAFGTTY